MNIIELIEGNPLLGEPELVFFGYCPPVDGERVEDPPEICPAIEKAGSRAMAWADACSALIALGSKRAASIRIDTKSWCLFSENRGGGWRIIGRLPRPGTLASPL